MYLQGKLPMRFYVCLGDLYKYVLRMPILCSELLKQTHIDISISVETYPWS